ncbi:hypothetical protein VTO42DRAFT_3637 [Malbranchea cinnamomea]
MSTLPITSSSPSPTRSISASNEGHSSNERRHVAHGNGDLATLPRRAVRGSSTDFDEGDLDQQTWAEFLRDEQDGKEDMGERDTPDTISGESFSSAGKKRRLTVSATDATSHGRIHSRARQDQTPEAASSELPRHVSWRNDSSGEAPGSSRDNAIDISGSPQSVSRQLNSLRHRESSFTDYRLPRWQPDSEVSKCPICGITFNFWYRKHHCRKCGRVVCASCSPHRITIPRQFIVRPPESQRSLSMIIQPNPSSSQVINLIDDEGEGDGMSAASPRGARTSGFASNPALGGGEEVRLCNPCVPDPNPEPPRRYGTLDPIQSPQRGTHRRSSYTSRQTDPQDSTSDPRRQNSHGSAKSVERLPSYRFDGRPPSYSPFERHPSVSTPTYSTSASPLGSRHHPSYPPSRSVPTGHRTHSYSYSHSGYTSGSRDRPLPRGPMSEVYQGINEQDLCPVCNLILPPRAANGSEEAREAHIRTCIERVSGRTQDQSAGSHTSPQASVGMLHFKATEKDCVGGDGLPQECTICMEEYEVGVDLTRLECLCKFHKSCILDWLQRKQECPVHKVT